MYRDENGNYIWLMGAEEYNAWKNGTHFFQKWLKEFTEKPDPKKKL